MRGDRPIVAFHFFAAVCPEPFVMLRVAPGQTTTWRTEYQLFEHRQP